MPKPLQRESDDSIDSSPLSSGLNRCLPTQQRIKKSAHFADTFSQKKKWVGRYMILWRRSSEDANLRLGVVTSKKVHLRANKRNYARRRMREVYRLLRPYFEGNYDIILIGRSSILKAQWKNILKELIYLANKAGLMSDLNVKLAEKDFQLADDRKPSN